MYASGCLYDKIIYGEDMKKYYKFELNIHVANILCLVLIIVPFILLMLTGNYDILFDPNMNNNIFFVSVILYFFLHELCHGLGYFIFAKDKSNIKFGVVLEHGVLYAMCQENLNKKAILISLFLPIILLTVIPLPFAVIYKLNILLLNAILNFAGAIGDILQAILIIKCPSDTEYLDYNNDVGCFLLSKSDLKKVRHFGFKLTEIGDCSDKQIDKSIKRIYISKKSYVYIVVFILIMLALSFI